MKKGIFLVMALIMLIVLSACKVQSESPDESTVQSTVESTAENTQESSTNAVGEQEKTTLSQQWEREQINVYLSKYNKVVAVVDGVDIEENLVRAVANQEGESKKTAFKKTVTLVAIYNYLEKNNIQIDYGEHQDFYDSDAAVAKAISGDALKEMGISREDFLRKLNQLTGLVAADSEFHKIVTQHVVDGDWTLEDKRMNKKYRDCVDELQKFYNNEMTYGKFYKNFEKFYDDLCDYLVDSADVEKR